MRDNAAYLTTVCLFEHSSNFFQAKNKFILKHEISNHSNCNLAIFFVRV